MPGLPYSDEWFMSVAIGEQPAGDRPKWKGPGQRISSNGGGATKDSNNPNSPGARRDSPLSGRPSFAIRTEVAPAHVPGSNDSAKGKRKTAISIKSEGSVDLPRKRSRNVPDVAAAAAAAADARQDSPQAAAIPTTTRKVNPASSERVIVPNWYKKLKKSTDRKKALASEDAKLGELKTYLKGSLAFDNPQRHLVLEKLINAIHDAMFLNVNGQLLRDHRLLDQEDGLQIPFGRHAGKYPFYIRLDAKELWFKWAARNFTVDLMHGIKMRKDATASIRPGYELKRSGAEFGDNDLVNGQWWPTQLCLVRDGCHTAAMGGIGGKAGQGAWSVVNSSGHVEGGGGYYPDVDSGDEILYCGTDGKRDEGQVQVQVPSENTRRLLESFERELPVRVVRSSKAVHGTSPFRPVEGYRYDGLYRVVGFEVLDRARQRHRFRMRRLEGQDPIRSSGIGAGERPTPQELNMYKKLKAEKRFVVADA